MASSEEVTFDKWWEEFGKDRHKEFCELVDSDDRFLFEEEE